MERKRKRRKKDTREGMGENGVPRFACLGHILQKIRLILTNNFLFTLLSVVGKLLRVL